MHSKFHVSYLIPLFHKIVLTRFGVAVKRLRCDNRQEF